LDLVVVREPFVAAFQATPRKFRVSVAVFRREKFDIAICHFLLDGINSFSLPLRIPGNATIWTPLALLNTICRHPEALPADVTPPLEFES
jgi:hypothetical protein